MVNVFCMTKNIPEVRAIELGIGDVIELFRPTSV